MVQLLKSDIKTHEVLEWKGVHLLHAPFSSCSQKTRIVLNWKQIPWVSHMVNLSAGENHQPWYLGINPRGLVPCLVHDGIVHIESNDIIEHLESAFPNPPVIPSAAKGRIHQLLRMEDDLHLDLRVLSFRYVIPTKPGAMKSAESLQNFMTHDGTIQGVSDDHKAEELEFWQSANRHGITDAQVISSARRFHVAFNELDATLGESEFLLGDELSILDIAWYIYAIRLSMAGYPLNIHPNLHRWFEKLDAHDEFRLECLPPEPMIEPMRLMREADIAAGRTLVDVTGY